MIKVGLKLGKDIAGLLFVLGLCGCSTIDGFLGGGMNDPANAEATQEVAEADVMGPVEPTAEELLAEKNQALVEQGMRIATAERELKALAEQNSALKSDLEAAQHEIEEREMLLDQANESQIAAAAAVNAKEGVPRMVAPNGGYGLHLASYELRESIEPGIAALTRQIPVLIEGKPIKISQATIRGRNYNRLIVGQFESQNDAQAECRQALLLVSFCEVVAFEGEDF